MARRSKHNHIHGKRFGGFGHHVVRRSNRVRTNAAGNSEMHGIQCSQCVLWQLINESNNSHCMVMGKRMPGEVSMFHIFGKCGENLLFKFS